MERVGKSVDKAKEEIMFYNKRWGMMEVRNPVEVSGNWLPGNYPQADPTKPIHRRGSRGNGGGKGYPYH